VGWGGGGATKKQSGILLKKIGPERCSIWASIK